MACYYSKSKDLSAGEILSSIYQGMVDKLADTKKEALSSPPVPVSVPYDEVPTLANFTTTIMQSGSPDAMVQVRNNIFHVAQLPRCIRFADLLAFMQSSGTCSHAFAEIFVSRGYFCGRPTHHYGVRSGSNERGCISNEN